MATNETRAGAVASSGDDAIGATASDGNGPVRTVDSEPDLVTHRHGPHR